MELITCKKCQKTYSSNEAKCPYCGYSPEKDGKKFHFDFKKALNVLKMLAIFYLSVVFVFFLALITVAILNQ